MWYAPHWTCLSCGDSVSEGRMMERPWAQNWWGESIAGAWRRILGAPYPSVEFTWGQPFALTNPAVAGALARPARARAKVIDRQARGETDE